jgi:thiamine-monophosphate kinase
MVSLKDRGERALIENIRGIVRPCEGIGPGDDAAVIKPHGDFVLSTDSVTFERHKPEGMSWEQFGWMAAAVNFSDIAGMGARPSGILSALLLPESMDENDLYDIMSGIDQCAEFCETEVLGGDTKPGNGSVTCTAVGNMEGRTPMTRYGASPGDIVAVTGDLGGPAAGYHAIKNGLECDDGIFSLMVPIPRWKEGMALADSGAVMSCMDISDGLAQSAKAICAASHTGMDIQSEFIPIAESTMEIAEKLGLDPENLALYWGGEYELMFTFKKEMIDKLYEAEIQFSIIGTVTNGKDVYIMREETRELMGNGIY